MRVGDLRAQHRARKRPRDLPSWVPPTPERDIFSYDGRSSRRRRIAARLARSAGGKFQSGSSEPGPLAQALILSLESPDDLLPSDD